MSQRLLASALALGLLTTLSWGTTSYASQSATQSHAVPAPALATADDPAVGRKSIEKPRTIARKVRLGHKPIAPRSSGKLKLTFKARKGTLVNLARWGDPVTNDAPPCASRFLLRKGKRLRRFAEGYWRLPRTGTYTAVYRWCKHDGNYQTGGLVQVRRTLEMEATTDGPAVTTSSRQDVSRLVAVDVNGPVLVESTGHVTHLVLPSRTTAEPLGSWPFLLLEPGTSPHTSGRDDQGPISQPGRHLLALDEPGESLRVTSSTQQQAAIDGDGVVLTNPGQLPRRHLVGFSGRAGQWVYTETTPLTGDVSWRSVELSGPFAAAGRHEVSLECPETSTDCGRDVEAWQLPYTGAYRLSLILQGQGSQSVRIRAAARALPLEDGGPAVTYSSTTPGQWVIGEIPGQVYNVSLSATNATEPLHDFRATAVPGWVPNCPVYDTSNGCGDYSRLSVTPGQPTAEGWWQGGDDAVLVLQVPPGLQGSVDLSWQGRPLVVLDQSGHRP